MSNKSETTSVGGGADRLSPEQRKALDEWFAKGPPPVRQLLPKAILAEVSPRMHAAVQAKPEALRMMAEDADGNAVIERPYRRPRSEEVLTPDRVGAVGGMKWGRSGWPNDIGNPVWDRPARGDELVKHQYDIFAVLREND
jgi:hypothetical protein